MKKLVLAALFATMLPLAAMAEARNLPATHGDMGVSAFINRPDAVFNPDVPTPFEVLGFNIGEGFPDWNGVLMYMEALNEASPRVATKYFGRTWQNRPFMQLYISSPKNIKNLDRIRAARLASLAQVQEQAQPGSAGGLRSSPYRGTEGVERSKVDDLLVVDLMASIHGNEASGVAAAVNAAYYYAASEDPAVAEMLKSTVIIITPGLNPDGINRFATWANTNASLHPVADKDSRESVETWPSSRTNHYWMDTNRDWMSVQHPEGENGVAMYREWMPNVVLDMHEQSSTEDGFYFSPGDPGRTYRHIPQENQDLTLQISYGTGAALDSVGAKHFSQWGYDDFFIGKGAAYGDLQGSVCILHEQIASRGHLRVIPEGILPYGETIRNQTVAALSVVESAYALKDTLLSYQRAFFARQERDAAADSAGGFRFRVPDRGTAYHFLEMLGKHDIQVYESADGGYEVPFERNQYYLVRAFFDDAREFRDSIFYDVSTWTQARAFNLEVEEIGTAGAGRRVTAEDVPYGSVEAGGDGVGYSFGLGEYYAPYLVNKLVENGYEVSVSDGMAFVAAAGGLYEFLMEHAPAARVDVSATGQARPLVLHDRPSVAVVTGSGMKVAQTGEIWHHLDVRYDMKHALVDYSRLGTAHLDKYNVMVFADGTPSGPVPEGYLDRVAEWVRAGGTLIVTGSAYKVSNEAGLTDIKSRRNGWADGMILKMNLEDSALRWGLPASRDFLPVFKMICTTYASDAGQVLASYDADPYLSGYVPEKSLAAIAGTPAIIRFKAGEGQVVFIADDLVWRSYWLGSSRVLTNAILFREFLG